MKKEKRVFLFKRLFVQRLKTITILEDTQVSYMVTT